MKGFKFENYCLKFALMKKATGGITYEVFDGIAKTGDGFIQLQGNDQVKHVSTRDIRFRPEYAELLNDKQKSLFVGIMFRGYGTKGRVEYIFDAFNGNFVGGRNEPSPGMQARIGAVGYSKNDFIETPIDNVQIGSRNQLEYVGEGDDFRIEGVYFLANNPTFQITSEHNAGMKDTVNLAGLRALASNTPGPGGKGRKFTDYVPVLIFFRGGASDFHVYDLMSHQYLGSGLYEPSSLEIGKQYK